MTRVLVTGGTGMLGSALRPRLIEAGYRVRVLSRRAAEHDQVAGVEWVQGDLATGAGVSEALVDVDVLVHSATRPFGRKVDIDGTRRLLAEARTAGVAHVVYPSIVGIDRIPFTYYKAKLAAEAIMRESGVPWSIARITQFHSFISLLFEAAARLPVMLLPTDFRTQPIAVDEAADYLVRVIQAGPSGRVPDIGGPEVRTFGDLAPAWQAARRRRRPILHLPVPGAVADGFRRGLHTCPEQRYGRTTWEEWLQGVAAAPTAAAPR